MKGRDTNMTYKVAYSTPTRGYVLHRSKGRLPVNNAVEGVEPPNGFEPLTCCLRITGGEVTGGRRMSLGA